MAKKYCALSVRKLKPGTYEEFREAWEPEEFVPGFEKAFHVRNVNDPDQVISFGFAEGTFDDWQKLQDDEKWTASEKRRQERMQVYVEELIVDGLYEVADEVVPAVTG